MEEKNNFIMVENVKISTITYFDNFSTKSGVEILKKNWSILSEPTLICAMLVLANVIGK